MKSTFKTKKNEVSFQENPQQRLDEFVGMCRCIYERMNISRGVCRKGCISRDHSDGTASS